MTQKLKHYGGQRAKVMLAKLLLESPDVMVLDEPTNFLDVNHIEWLTKFINSSDRAFIIVSHDTHFLNNVVTHICDVDNNKINKYVGSYDKCMEIKEAKRVQHEKNYEQQQREIKRWKITLPETKHVQQLPAWHTAVKNVKPLRHFKSAKRTN